MSREIDLQVVHERALAKVSQDASIGRIPFYDYLLEYQSALGLPFQNPDLDLIHFLESSEKIGDSKNAGEGIEKCYSKYSVEIPVGLLDLPIWWTPAIIETIESTNWVEVDSAWTRKVFGWTYVQIQGAFLDIQFENPINGGSSDWFQVAHTLIDLHRRLEPGPLTSPKRLVEFI